MQAGPFEFRLFMLTPLGAALQVPLSKLAHSPCLCLVNSVLGSLFLIF